MRFAPLTDSKMAKRSKRSKTKQEPQTAQQPTRPKITLEQIETTPWFLPVLGVLGLIMGILLFDSNLSLSGDNAQFINLGRSLAAGYGLSETLGDTPTPHTKYPFGFPVLLAIVDIIIPKSLIALKSFVLLLYAVSIPLVYKFVRQYANALLSLFVAVLCLVSTPLLNFSHQVMSEIPFLPFALLALILFQRAHESESTKTLLLAILASIAAYYIRSAGIVLVGTGVIFFALHQKWKQAGIIAGGSLLLALPWQIRNRALGGSDYVNQLFSINPYDPEQGLLTFSTFLERIITNAQIYGLRVIPEVFVPSFAPQANIVLGIIFTGMVLYAIVISIQKRQLPAVFLICYLGLYLLWPQVWSDIRFLIPAIPILFYAFLTGLSDLTQKINTSITPKAILVTFIIVLTSNSVATHELSERNGQLPPNWKTYFDAGEWIKNNTDPSVKIACRKPFLMNAITNRKSGGYVWESPDEIIADFEKNNVDIVIVDQIGFPSTPDYLVPAVNTHINRFDILHVVPNPKTYILKFKKKPSPSQDEE